MATISLPFNWRPRPYQQAAWDYLEKGGKRAALVWHRRAGKDELALHRTAVAAFERPADYWHMLPEYAQARKAIWEATNPHTGKRRIDEVFPKEIREKTREDEMMIRFKNGSTWRVVGSDNYDSLVGAPPAGIVLSEWALANPTAWGMLRPMLAENGGWAIFPYTPRGLNHGHKTFELFGREEGTFAQVLTAEDTGVFSKETLETEQRQYWSDYGKEQGESLFRQEYYCSFEAAILGAFYAEELRIAQSEQRICRVPYDRGQVVHTAWDLGFTDASAIWFVQVVGRELRWIDYYEATGVGLDHYAKVLKEKGYLYGSHYLPHDVMAHELIAGKSRFQTLVSLGITPTVVPQHSVLDGINASRRMIQRSVFNQDTTERGLEALRNYRRDWDDKRKIFRPAPLHDWTSHGSDAFRTFAAGFAEPTVTERERYSRRSSKSRNGSSWMAA